MSRRVALYSTGGSMRKLIMMAIAGYVMKKVQARFMKQNYSVTPARRY
jgi:hypothetical protein